MKWYIVYVKIGKKNEGWCVIEQYESLEDAKKYQVKNGIEKAFIIHAYPEEVIVIKRKLIPKYEQTTPF